jgi:hypothetical protein
MTMAGKKWHTRGLTSLLTLAGFLIMSITGLVLYLVPQGRIAYWTEWSLISLTKEQWGDVHILASIFFIVAGAFHIWFNWKPLLNYLSSKTTGALKHKKEIVIACLAALVLIAGGIWRIPPLSYLLDLNAAIKDSWVVEKDYEPPFGHAELLTLKVFCKKTDIPFEQAAKELKDKGLQGVAPDVRLVDLGRANNLSPLEIYRLIVKFQVVEEIETPAVMTPEKVEETFAGTGIGNQSIPEICARLNLDVKIVMDRLEKKGIKADPEAGLKTVAGKAGLAPLELLKAALVEDYQPK